MYFPDSREIASLEGLTLWWPEIMSQPIPAGYIPRENFFGRANPGHQGNFLSNSPALGQKMVVEFPEVGQNFPKLEETAPLVCRNPLKIKKTTRRYKLKNLYILG